MEGYVDGGRVRTGGEVFTEILKTVDNYLEGLRKSAVEGEPVLKSGASYLKANRLTFEVSKLDFEVFIELIGEPLFEPSRGSN